MFVLMVFRKRKPPPALDTQQEGKNKPKCVLYNMCCAQNKNLGESFYNLLISSPSVHLN